MNDPERLKHGASGDLASALVGAGSDEQPSELCLRRTLAVATAATASTFATGAAAASGVMAKGAGIGAASVAAPVTKTGILGVVVAKWMGVGLLSGLAVTTAIRELPRVLDTEASPPTSGSPRAPAVGQSALTAPFDSRRGDSKEAGSTATAAERESPLAPATARRSFGTAVAAERGEPVQDTAERDESSQGDQGKASVLAEEIAFVDRGRMALKRGDPQAALSLLQLYEARFSEKQLLTEVLFLRMEALDRIGSSEQARQLARQIVERNVASGQAARARQIIEGSNPAER